MPSRTGRTKSEREKERKGKEKGSEWASRDTTHVIPSRSRIPRSFQPSLACLPLPVLLLCLPARVDRDHPQGECSFGGRGSHLATHPLIFICSLVELQGTVVKWACWCPGFLPADRPGALGLRHFGTRTQLLQGIEIQGSCHLILIDVYLREKGFSGIVRRCWCVP